MSPKTLPEAAYEGLTDPAPQKTETMHQILKLFEFGPQLVEAAYGNKESDTRAYLAAGVPRDRIYVVNTDSELHNVASMGQQQASSYGLEADAVDQKFPKIDSDGGPEYEDGSIHFG